MITISNTLLQKKEEIETQDVPFVPNAHQNIEQIELAHTVLEMPVGMIGFEHIKQYSIELLDGDVLYRLEGMPESSPVFYLINPYLIVPNYQLSISDEDYEILISPVFDDIIVFSILTLKDSLADTTCNLLGPLVINNKKGLMLQVINNSDDWGTKHLLSNGEKVVELQAK